MPTQNATRNRRSSSSSSGGSKKKSGGTGSKASSSGSTSRSSSANNGRSTESEAQVAARAELEQGSGTAHIDNLEDKAKEQEKAQADALANPPAPARSHEPDTVAEARTEMGQGGVGPVGGRIDQTTRTDPSQVMQGHFCTVDRTAEGVAEILEEAGVPAGEDGYGVYNEPAGVGKDGYPASAIVRLRGDSPALITVPYESLRPAEAGRR